jgi:hypothetical protein
MMVLCIALLFNMPHNVECMVRKGLRTENYQDAPNLMRVIMLETSETLMHYTHCCAFDILIVVSFLLLYFSLKVSCNTAFNQLLFIFRVFENTIFVRVFLVFFLRFFQYHLIQSKDGTTYTDHLAYHN